MANDMHGVHIIEENWSPRFENICMVHSKIIHLIADLIIIFYVNVTKALFSIHSTIGAPRQNRTAITGLQNQCNAIILVGRVCLGL